MIRKTLLLAAGTLLAITQPALAGDRYQERPPVMVSPDLSAPWVLQLGGTVRAPSPTARTGIFASQGRSQRTIYPAAPSRSQQVAVATRPNKPVHRETDPRFLPQVVDYNGSEAPGTIVIDTTKRYLYLVMGNGQARRYGVGVGKPGFEWAGKHKITAKREWPGWTPPQEMITREAAKGHYLPAHMEGGPENPLGARAMYLGSTLYRIHGTNAPWTIGYGVSSGCIRMRNQDVTDLYDRVKVGTTVVVM